ncbi:MAG: GNAT family N-acetyltransferase [Deltaproteobacteria bacterium]|nr:GNAT family N-acetyltransferase [Deltaproteobacteria bacterium]
MIRPFSLSDLDAILKIEQESFPKSPYDRMTFIELHSFCPETFLVYTETSADQRNQVWGYIIFIPEGRIISIAVLPSQRRKGIGKELLQKAMEIPDLKRLQVEVRRSNLGAQVFYSHLGFEKIGISKNYYGNEDAIIMQWIPIS